MTDNIEENMNSTTESPKAGCSDCGVKATDHSRRKFTQAAFTAPVLASLISAPAWGTACSISGLRSTNLSGHNHEECDGSGCTPGFWSQNLDAWKLHPYAPGSCDEYKGNGDCKQWNTTIGASTFKSAFGDDFPLSPIDPDTGMDYTLIDVMLDHENWGSEGTYYFHLVAALFNAIVAPDLYGSTEADVIALFQDVRDGLIDYHDALATLDKMNNAGTCFIDAHGNFLEDDGLRTVEDPNSAKTIPACKEGFSWNHGLQKCVRDNK